MGRIAKRFFPFFAICGVLRTPQMAISNSRCYSIANLLLDRIYFGYTLHWDSKIMYVKVQKWGNSQGIRLSKEILAQANILVGDELEIVTTQDQIVIKPAHKIRGKYKIEDLVAKLPANYQAEELDWGTPVGIEVW
ncbi:MULTISPECIES: AbrB/MazE/SpoVT family DNA-binding domain-containing protein [Pseudanabaena]|nr:MULTISPECIES: AbrB/MazE/SpoVT family DNA-binding domain-containing protein [Pseudanabaena]MEA5487014.1 AbrB/MazE/SpoVT family DNA-binding domain-containing protein [Pseudanabaena sp. CCNP1317]WGS71779.1 AbrB/MazE/SpoVT family DNA-binding domain-containing protein [Pseudanabaena galeata CCNP1313]